jgi:hypothetical protein
LEEAENSRLAIIQIVKTEQKWHLSSSSFSSLPIHSLCVPRAAVTVSDSIHARKTNITNIIAGRRIVQQQQQQKKVLLLDAGWNNSATSAD